MRSTETAWAKIRTFSARCRWHAAVPIGVLAALPLWGCATLTGTHQVVSVDSDPRGEWVVLPDAESNGENKTPFFARIHRSSQITIHTTVL